jgi:hypothetical protein
MGSSGTKSRLRWAVRIRTNDSAQPLAFVLKLQIEVPCQLISAVASVKSRSPFAKRWRTGADCLIPSVGRAKLKAGRLIGSGIR